MIFLINIRFLCHQNRVGDQGILRIKSQIHHKRKKIHASHKIAPRYWRIILMVVLDIFPYVF